MNECTPADEAIQARRSAHQDRLSHSTTEQFEIENERLRRLSFAKTAFTAVFGNEKWLEQALLHRIVHSDTRVADRQHHVRPRYLDGRGAPLRATVCVVRHRSSGVSATCRSVREITASSGDTRWFLCQSGSPRILHPF